MTVVVNGEERQVESGASVTDLVTALGLDPGRLAVEVNGRIVRKAEWGSTELAEGDKIEIVHFVGGGSPPLPPREVNARAERILS